MMPEEDPDGDAQFPAQARFVGRQRRVPGGAREPSGDEGGGVMSVSAALMVMKKPSGAGQSRCAVVLMAKPTPTPTANRRPEVRKRRRRAAAKKATFKGPAVAEPKEQARDGQNGDGQHQRPTSFCGRR